MKLFICRQRMKTKPNDSLLRLLTLCLFLETFSLPLSTNCEIKLMQFLHISASSKTTKLLFPFCISLLLSIENISEMNEKVINFLLFSLRSSRLLRLHEQSIFHVQKQMKEFSRTFKHFHGNAIVILIHSLSRFYFHLE